ncbi:hypothetical protein RP20_CCG005207 [Aedes albopictus]|nr:hypothetical protein RP20_CCG005207 [Aedes albopictus]
MARCMIIESGLHYRYWAEAVNTANCLQNMLPTKPVQQTPYEIWYGTKPDMSMLQVFGSEAYVFIPKEKRTKLQSKARKMTFVGYSQQHKAWRFIDLKTNEVVFSRDARFLQSGEKVEDAVAEDFFELAQMPARPTGNVEQEESDGSDEETDESDGGPDEDSDEEEFRGFDDESCENLVRGFDDPADQSVYEDPVEVMNLAEMRISFLSRRSRTIFRRSNSQVHLVGQQGQRKVFHLNVIWRMAG